MTHPVGGSGTGPTGGSGTGPGRDRRNRPNQTRPPKFRPPAEPTLFTALADCGRAWGAAMVGIANLLTGGDDMPTPLPPTTPQ